MKQRFLPGAIVAAALAALGVVAVFAASTDTQLHGGDDLRIHCDGSKLTTTRLSTTEVLAKCVAAPTATPTKTSVPATATATSTKAATSTPTKTPTSVPAATATPTSPS